jgi:hypothetical protein
MTTAESSPQILYADQEHSGLRTAIFISLFAALGLGFLFLRNTLPDLLPFNLDDYAPFLSCLGAIPLALAIVWGIELTLKRYWHSGLSLVLDETGITIEDRRSGQLPLEASGQAGQPAFRWAKAIRYTNWYFRLSGYTRGGRERRVPAKWYCLACELQQDDNRLNLYTFMPPERADALLQQKRGLFTFHPISPAELQTNTIRSRFGPPSRPVVPNQLLHAKDGRYWLAERRRWEQGIELTADDFETLMTYAQRHQVTAPETPGEETERLGD